MELHIHRCGSCLNLLRSAILLMALAFAGVSTANSQTLNSGTFLIGAYDPYGTFKNKVGLSVEHIYIPWRHIDLSSLRTADTYALQRGRMLLVTVEPWSWAKFKKVSPQDLYNQIVLGKHDRRIDEICHAISELKSDVTVRWGHEMDIESKRYPWAQWSPSQYKSAYRYFVTRCRTMAREARFMWSPRGEATLNNFYPGNDYVDSVGVSVFAIQARDHDEHRRNLSLREHVAATYARVERYEYPIWISEFGCDGDEEYIEECEEDISYLKTQFPMLAGLIYFNELETYPLGRYGLPDWRKLPLRASGLKATVSKLEK